MFISLSRTYIQNFSNWHALFVFLSHSVAVAAWCGTRHVDQQMTHFELFFHLVRRSQLNPQTILVHFRQLKKTYCGYLSKKDNHSGPLLQQVFCTSQKFETSWALLGRLLSRGFFSFAISGASNFKHSFAFHEPVLDLACLCDGFLVESPILYLAFFKTGVSCLIRDSWSSPSFLAFKTFITPWSFYHPTWFPSFFFLQLLQQISQQIEVYMLILSRSGTSLRKEGSSLMTFTKYKERIRAIRTMKY